MVVATGMILWFTVHVSTAAERGMLLRWAHQQKMAEFAGISSTSTSEEGEDTAGARGRKLI
jgi:hypothetical protein